MHGIQMSIFDCEFAQPCKMFTLLLEWTFTPREKHAYNSAICFFVVVGGRVSKWTETLTKLSKNGTFGLIVWSRVTTWWNLYRNGPKNTERSGILHGILPDGVVITGDSHYRWLKKNLKTRYDWNRRHVVAWSCAAVGSSVLSSDLVSPPTITCISCIA